MMSSILNSKKDIEHTNSLNRQSDDADFASVGRDMSETTPYRNRNLQDHLYAIYIFR